MKRIDLVARRGKIIIIKVLMVAAGVPILYYRTPRCPVLLVMAVVLRTWSYLYSLISALLLTLAFLITGLSNYSIICVA